MEFASFCSVFLILAAFIHNCSGAVSDSLLCYQCLHTSSVDGNGKPTSSGNINCRDPFYSEKVTKVKCTGSCYKTLKNMGDDSQTFDRGCMTEKCKETEGTAQGTETITTCCKDSYCNMAPKSAPAIFVLVVCFLALMFV